MRLVFITEVESVYSSVRTESLYKTDRLRFQMVNIQNISCSDGSFWDICGYVYDA
jgi:hypothetical protein